jgi:hypothetical protein
LIDPSDKPKQEMFEWLSLKFNGAFGCVIVVVYGREQPFKSVTVKLYEPAVRPLISCVIPLFDH